MSEPRSDINQLLMQVNLISRTDEDSSPRLIARMRTSPMVHLKQNSSKQICRRWLSQQSSLLPGESPVFFWRLLILKYSVWCKRNLASHSR